MNILYKVDDEIVFYSPNLDRSVALDLKNQVKTGYDIEGNAIPFYDAVRQYFMMCDRDLSNQIKANMDLSSTILSIVRNDLIDLSMADAITTLSSMQSIIFMVQMGLFHTAAELLDSTPRTSILTDALLTKYSAMLRSSDAIR